MYSPLNPVSSSQTQIIPESPERRGLTHNRDRATGIFLYDRPKSESPELVPSVHEFPSSSAVTGTSATSIQQCTQQGPTAPSSVPEVAKEHNADIINGERIEKVAQVDLKGPKAPSPELRQSPFAGHPISNQGSLGNEKSLTELRRRISNPPDPIESDADGSQEHQHVRNEEQPQVPQSPVRIAESGVTWSPSRPNSSTRDNVLGQTSISATGDKLSQGSQAPNERHKTASAINTLHSCSSTVGTEPESAIAPSSLKNPQPASQASNVVDLEDDIEEQCDTVPSGDSMATQEHQPDKSEPAKQLSATNRNSIVPDEADTEGLQQSPDGNLPSSHLASTVQKESTPFQDQRKAHPGVSSAKTLERERSLEARTKGKRKALTESSKTDFKPSSEDSLNLGSGSSRNENRLADKGKPAVGNGSGNESARATTEQKDSELDAFNVPDSETEPKPPKSRLTKRAVSKIVENSVAKSELEADRQRLEQEKRDRKNALARERRAEKKAQLARSTNFEIDNTAEVVESQPDHETRGPLTKDISKKRRVAETEAVEEPRNKSSNLSAEKPGRKAIAGNMASQPEAVESLPDQENRELSTRIVNKKRRVAETGAVEEPKNNSSNLSEKKSGRKALAGKTADQQDEAVADEVERIALAMKSGQRHRSKTPSNRGLKSKADAGPTNGMVQRLRESADIESTRSSSPSNRHEPFSKRRSMTPMFPASSAAKPIKSALRTSESANRRSVSFNDEAIIAPDALTSVTSKTSKLAKNSEASQSRVVNKATKTTSSSSNVKTAPARSKESPEGRKGDSLNDTQPLRTGTRKSETPSKDTESKPKVQTKLNVTRDVKLKGRALDPPVPRKAATTMIKEEVVISSESERSDSTYYSDEEDRARNPKAGPSTRRSLRSSMKSGAEPEPSNMELPTKSQSLKKGSDTMKNNGGEVPASPQSRHPSQERSRAMSKSRSPAQYMSGAASVSSRSGSEAESRTASEGDSTSRSESDSGSESNTASEGHTAEREQSPKAARNSKGTISQGEPKATKETSPAQQSSSDEEEGDSASSSPSKSSSEEEEEDLAGQQLHRESHQSLERTPSKDAEPSLPTTTKSAPSTTPNTRFPTLSTLREQGRNMDPAKNAAHDSRAPAHKPVQRTTSNSDNNASSSSSDDDDEDSSSSSNSDSETGTRKTQQPNPKPKSSSVLKGLRGVIKCTYPPLSPHTSAPLEIHRDHELRH